MQERNDASHGHNHAHVSTSQVASGPQLLASCRHLAVVHRPKRERGRLIMDGGMEAWTDDDIASRIALFNCGEKGRRCQGATLMKWFGVSSQRPSPEFPGGNR